MADLFLKDDFVFSKARLTIPPAEKMLKHFEIPTIEYESKCFGEFNRVDIAHTIMLAEQDIISVNDAQQLIGALLRLKENPSALKVNPVKGSLLLQVEAFLSECISEDVAGRMHTGRSRIDQGTTARRLFERDHLLLIFQRLNTFRAVLIAKSAAHKHAIMPGYTHMQHAQPWVFGHYLLSVCDRLTDDFSRTKQAFSRVNMNSLGAAGLVGTSWPLDRSRTTELLGFEAVLDNSKLGREAYFSAETLSVLSILMSTLNDLATDLHLWSSIEFGFVEANDAYCGTSSIFPQKKNPAALEAIKKTAGAAVTWLANALATFRAEGTGDQAMRDVAVIFEALDQTDSMLDLFAGIIETLTVHENKMRAALNNSWCTSSNLADVLVRKTGLSFRHVHHIVARLVRICTLANVSPRHVQLSHLEQASQEVLGKSVRLTEVELREALDPETFVQTRVTQGSIAPGEVERMLGRARTELAQDMAWLESELARQRTAETRLNEAIKKMMTAKTAEGGEAHQCE